MESPLELILEVWYIAKQKVLQRGVCCKNVWLGLATY